MCGLAGFWTPAGFGAAAGSALLQTMTDRIRSRGPDSSGVWLEPEQGVALGHRRLSILELSPAGAQPMSSDSGRYVLVFNGEIYNHLAIREDLPAATPYRGHSDTETLLRAFDTWGIEQALTRAVGMFALACFDRQTRTLILARDRMGEKPLYYGWQGSGSARSLLFGSELKALTCHPAFERRIEHASVARYLERLCVPGTASIWQGIGKVPPGATLRFSASHPEGKATSYWDIAEVAAKAKQNPITDPTEALELVHDRLVDAVKGQLLSDVPLGAFLSGGVDSSLIVALMQQASGGRCKTFSIGFEEAAYNEAGHARAVAEHLRTAHTELIVSAAEAQEVIPDLPGIYDEPFADSSQIPTYLVARMARADVTVALSGDGADELFGGYTRYTKALRAWQSVNAVPGPVRRAASGLVQLASPILPRRHSRAAAVAGAANVVDFYHRFTNHALVHPGGPYGADPTTTGGLSPAEMLMAADQTGYLPDDILVKVDRAAMAVSLETRAPYLDHRVVEMSWQLDPAIKRCVQADATIGKWPLRRLLDRYVSPAITERPKQGFGIPVGAWMRGPLRDWADDLLAPDRLSRIDVLDPGPIGAAWRAHRAGTADFSEQVWAAAMLSAWYDEHATASLAA